MRGTTESPPGALGDDVVSREETEPRTERTRGVSVDVDRPHDRGQQRRPTGFGLVFVLVLVLALLMVTGVALHGIVSTVVQDLMRST